MASYDVEGPSAERRFAKRPSLRGRATQVRFGNDMSKLASKILHWGFRSYVRRFVRRHFNAVRVAGWEPLTELPPGPLVCFANHPGWWDPMTAVLMTDLMFPERDFAAPMDAEALRSYPVLERLGFFPVQRETYGGVRAFLHTSRELLKSPKTILWLTPTGQFHDARQPRPFLNGLSCLVDHDFPGSAVPVAIEYTFWNERSPELLLQFGSAVKIYELPQDRAARTIELERALKTAQSRLAELAIARDPDRFTTVALGRAGIGGIYDIWRRLHARMQGRPFQDRHSRGSLPTTKMIKRKMI
jgi:1-acyl-sn-glycerol-3-phosphate acyltransferase